MLRAIKYFIGLLIFVGLVLMNIVIAAIMTIYAFSFIFELIF